MKLNYDRKSKDPTYFIQMGIRNGKKTTTKNVARIGKHSELLKITDDPLAYAKEQVKKYNEEYKNKNYIGYFFLQQFYHDLKMDSFFESVTADRKNEFDPNLINRSDACTALNAITGLGLDKKYYQPKELNKKIKIILK